jgi:hypothetical protein
MITMGEDDVASFRPLNMEAKKNKTKFFVAKGGRQSMIKHNVQPNSHGRDGRRIGQEAQLAGNAGGAVFDCFGDDQVGSGRGERIK